MTDIKKLEAVFSQGSPRDVAQKIQLAANFDDGVRAFVAELDRVPATADALNALLLAKGNDPQLAPLVSFFSRPANFTRGVAVVAELHRLRGVSPSAPAARSAKPRRRGI